ncbi:hypothetical protein S40288_01012 [Stachybotrys chartarum IBT 40288]|nr:hypothetical protein S40288_01012 [Stachybotrys chartarum IBT 40288]
MIVPRHSCLSTSLGLLFVFLLREVIADEAFADPPTQYRPWFRYWLPDASVSSEVVTQDVHQIAAAGAGGLEFLAFELYGLPHLYGEEPERPTDWSLYGFGTPAFAALLKDTLRATMDAGIALDFALGANQAQGVPSEPETPGLSFELRQGNVTLRGGESFDGPVPPYAHPNPNIVDGSTWRHPHERFGTSELVAVMAYKVLGDEIINRTVGPLTYTTHAIQFDPSTYVDLNSLVQDGQLAWTAPGGDDAWFILTYWEKYTNQKSTLGGHHSESFIGNGSWTTDKFNKAGAELTTSFWDTYLLNDEEVAAMVRDVVGHAWEDSLEPLATLYWTHGILDRFDQRNGYSLVKYLPLLFNVANTWTQGFPPYFEEFSFANSNTTANSDGLVNVDYRATKTIGVKFRHQPAYNLPLEMLSDIPLLDTPEGESFGFGGSYESFREFVAPAHQSGKKVISSELGASPTPAYSQTIPALLDEIKRSIAGGFSQHVLHGFPYSGNYPNTTWPGYTTFFYRFTDMWNMIQPGWQHISDALAYVGRLQYIAQQGDPKVDLAFFKYESPWIQRAPLINTDLLGVGFTYGFTASDNLLLPDAFVENGTIFPNGPAYKALVFYGEDARMVTLSAADKLIQLASDGLPVIFIGDSIPDQVHPVTEENFQKLAVLVQELLNAPNVHRIDSRDDLLSFLAHLEVFPRVGLDCTNDLVYQTYRSDAEAGVDYVYIVNDNVDSTQCSVRLNVGDAGAPYIYNAWTGDQSPVAVCERDTESKTVTVPISLQSKQTLILAVRHGDASASANTCRVVSTTEGIASVASNPDGTVQFVVTADSSLKSRSGKTFSFAPELPSPTNLKIWDITVEDWHAPEDNRFEVRTEITTRTFPQSELRPWSALGEGMDAVSGVGHYSTNFATPDKDSISGRGPNTKLGAILSLGIVQHTMRVRIDGESLLPIDPSNPILDISSWIKPGQTHTIDVEVTSPLFNRIKADRNETMIWGTVASGRQPAYETMAPREEGLLGPVVIHWAVIEELGCIAREI